MAFGKRLIERFLQPIGTHNGAHFEQCTEHNHVKHFGILHFCCFVHRVNTINAYVVALGRIDNSKAIVDEYAAGFELGHELV